MTNPAGSVMTPRKEKSDQPKRRYRTRHPAERPRATTHCPGGKPGKPSHHFEERLPPGVPRGGAATVNGMLHHPQRARSTPGPWSCRWTSRNNEKPEEPIGASLLVKHTAIFRLCR